MFAKNLFESCRIDQAANTRLIVHFVHERAIRNREFALRAEREAILFRVLAALESPEPVIQEEKRQF